MNEIQETKNKILLNFIKNFRSLTVSDLRHIRQSLSDIWKYAGNSFECYDFSDMAKGLLDNLSIETTEDYETTANLIFEIFTEIISHENKSLTAKYSLLCKMAIRYWSAQSIDCIHQLLSGKTHFIISFFIPFFFFSTKISIDSSYANGSYSKIIKNRKFLLNFTNQRL